MDDNKGLIKTSIKSNFNLVYFLTAIKSSNAAIKYATTVDMAAPFH